MPDASNDKECNKLFFETKEKKKIDEMIKNNSLTATNYR